MYDCFYLIQVKSLKYFELTFNIAEHLHALYMERVDIIFDKNVRNKVGFMMTWFAWYYDNALFIFCLFTDPFEFDLLETLIIFDWFYFETSMNEIWFKILSVRCCHWFLYWLNIAYWYQLSHLFYVAFYAGFDNFLAYFDSYGNQHMAFQGLLHP